VKSHEAYKAEAEQLLSWVDDNRKYLKCKSQMLTVAHARFNVRA